MAREYKLDLLYRKSFHDVFVENQEDPELKPLLVRMKVVDKDGVRAMDDAQWEAASTSFFLISMFFFPTLLNF
jgi:mRNA (guanine-N7-)-methyltransferase